MPSTVAVAPAPTSGRALPGLPAGMALSPSRAADFLTCPLLFRYRAIDRFPERPGAAAARGTLVHSVLEELFDLPTPERTLAAAAELLLPAWNNLVAAEPALTYALDAQAPFIPAEPDRAPTPTAAQVADWITGAEPLLETYFSLEDPTRLEPGARELRLEVQLPEGPPLRGIVDRLDIAPSGLLRVVDYKTGRSPGPGFEQKSLFQMRFYALMLWKIRGVIPKRLQLIYLGNGEVLRYDPSEDELVAFEQKLRALWVTITEVAATGDWQPKASKLCDWCDHHQRCPIKGGQIPSLPVEIEVGRSFTTGLSGHHGKTSTPTSSGVTAAPKKG